MTPERWQQVQDVLEKALELAPGERSAYLKQACSSDPSLRQEVETLLASSDHVRSSFLQSPPPRVALASGTKLGDYQVKSLLGSGGMGEVYRARDARLGRDVAIKVLPALLSADSERLRRFEHEARAAAALNHPNILAVFQMGTYEGAPYLVSELLEGETLREQLNRGRLSVRKAIDYGVQIARGLGAAHEKGIVHRDLKPENLFVTKDGRVKILDFGLAKLTQQQSSSGHDAPTLTAETEAGVVMGTVGYMSPEQVRGQTADHRADIFAFGAILYEMLAGKRAFQKPTSPETMSAILNEDPPGISQVAANIPPALQRVVHRCLEKNPEQRFQSASDLAFALDALSDSGGSAHSATAARIATGAGKRWKAIVAAAVAVLALSVGGYFYFHRTPKLTDKDTIVLADFENHTGDSLFDDTLKEALAIQLEQSSFLNVLSDQKMNAALKLMNHKPGDRITLETAREICQRTDSKALLAGSITSLGSHYLIGLKAINCQTGDSLGGAEVEAEAREKVVKALSEVAGVLRGKLGESLASVKKSDKPLDEATTSSLEALQAYTQGTRTAHEQGDQYALPYLQRAVELDPNFALAYASLGDRYMALEQPSLAIANYKKAFDLRGRVSERERLHIEGMYYLNGSGELEKAVQVLKEYVQAYPNDVEAHNSLAYTYYVLGQWDKSAVECRESLRRNPDDGFIASTLIADDLFLNRPDDAKAVYEQGRARNLQNGFPDSVMYVLAVGEGDATGMQHYFDASMGKPGIEDVVLSMRSDAEAYHGRLGRAREFSQRAEESARKNGAKETAALWQAYAALHEAEVGSTVEASRQAKAALSVAPGRDARVLAAMALARAGNTNEVTKLVDALNQESPLDTVMQSNVLPTIRAMLALSQGRGEQALKLLTATSGYELAVPQVFLNTQPAMYPIYVRGQAYLRAGQGQLAVAEFQKMVAFRLMSYPLGALSRLQLGRAYVLRGDTANAKAAYQDFFTLWKDADPDIPILKEAKAEYAKLQ